MNRIATIVVDYIKRTEKTIREYYKAAPKETRKKFMVWADQNIPKKYRGYCKDLYVGKTINVLKTHDCGSPKYLKLKDMGVSDYSKIFTEETNDE